MIDTNMHVCARGKGRDMKTEKFETKRSMRTLRTNITPTLLDILKLVLCISKEKLILLMVTRVWIIAR